MDYKLTFNEYREAWREGRFMGLKCNQCQAYTVPPRKVCAECGSENLAESSFCNQCGEKL